jgi:bifunctional NMN adenylyltransferase/nudix hydrolase
MTSFEYAVLIGRFAPFHNGHQALLAQALQQAGQVVVFIGSPNKPRTIRTPWRAAEREAMIRATFAVESARLHIRPLRDHLYNEMLWTSEVQRMVGTITHGAAPTSIAIMSSRRDGSRNCAELFPQWHSLESEVQLQVSAREIRKLLFTANDEILAKQAAVPAPVFALLQAFRRGPHFAALVREYQYVQDYRNAWAAAPYPPIFVTVDAVVMHSGHVLLVRRRNDPGQGLWALPGGFVDQDERLQHAVIRELREETQLALSDDELLRSLKAHMVFDDPQRSLRGRTITHAHYFDLRGGALPAVIGGDDAEQARWVPLSEALTMEEKFFDDHFHVLEYFVGRGGG